MQKEEPLSHSRQRRDRQSNRIPWSEGIDYRVPSAETLSQGGFGCPAGLRVGEGGPAQRRLPHCQGDSRRRDDTECEHRCHGQKESNPAPVHGRPRRATASLTLSE